LLAPCANWFICQTSAGFEHALLLHRLHHLLLLLLPLLLLTPDIMPGQGLYFETISNTWRARNCTSNSYGVDKLAYGLTPSPCKSCPQNMVTSTDNTTHPRSAAWYVSDAATATAGYTSPLACVNQAGFGYNGRVSQPCDRGTWSARDSHGTCVPCGYGLTTSAVGAGRTQADCGIAAGFGFDGANVVPCQIGETRADCGNGDCF
jgi:hypothetical protein